MSRALHPLHEGEFARPVNGDEQIEFPLGRLDLGDVNEEEADRIGLEPLLWLLVALDIRASLWPAQSQLLSG
jgi:hypothetical protein